MPLGVIGIIYESRPNVTADAGALALKAGNAAILRGGSESHHSSARDSCLPRRRPAAAGLPEAAIQLVPTTDRDAVGDMLRWPGRHHRRDRPARRQEPGASACRRRRACRCSRISKASATPTSTATPNSTWRSTIVLNAKMRRTGVCGATEMPARRQERAGDGSADAGQGAARRRLRGARRCGHAESRCARQRLRPRPTGRRNISTPSSP